MIIKPPPGMPRSCWNIYDGKPKKQYDTLQEAQELADTKPNYQAYLCSFCKKHHIGRLSVKDQHYYERNPEIEFELGTRVVAHMNSGDDMAAIVRRFNTARDLLFRRPT